MTTELFESMRERQASRRGFVRGTAVVAGGALALAGVGGGAHRMAALAQDATPAAGSGTVLQPGIDSQMQEVIDELVTLNKVPIAQQTAFNGRQLPLPSDAILSILSKRGEVAINPSVAIEHVLIPTPDDGVIARVYTPAGQAPFPVIVYYHGGGFVIANLDDYDSSCRALATAAEAVVISVAYRLAPENPFPAPVDDAYFAFQYVAENAGLYGGDPDRVAVVGESAGGNLAAVVSLLARDQGGILPVHQVLVYPITTYAPEGEGADTIEEFATAAPLNAALLDWFQGFYAPDPASPNASPLLAADLSGLPPTTIILAEIDPLIGQGRQYAEALEEAGNDVTVTEYAGVTHEFFGTGAVVDIANEAVAEVAERLTASFEDAAEATPTA